MLDEVTAERAEALGIAGAGELLVGLRARHLPVAWEQDRRCMRPHPRFREYLVERLGRRPATEVRALRRAHGELLLTEGHHEEAADELLRAGARDEALAPAEQAIRRVVERLDFAVAERMAAGARARRRDVGPPHLRGAHAGDLARGLPPRRADRRPARARGGARPPRPVLAAERQHDGLVSLARGAHRRCERGHRDDAEQPRGRRRPLSPAPRPPRPGRRAGAPAADERGAARRAHHARALRPRAPARRQPRAGVLLGRGGRHAVAHRRAAGDGQDRAGARALRGDAARHLVAGVDARDRRRRAHDRPRRPRPGAPCARPGPGAHPRDGLDRLRDAQPPHRGEARAAPRARPGRRARDPRRARSRGRRTALRLHRGAAGDLARPGAAAQQPRRGRRRAARARRREHAAVGADPRAADRGRAARRGALAARRRGRRRPRGRPRARRRDPPGLQPPPAPRAGRLPRGRRAAPGRRGVERLGLARDRPGAHGRRRRARRQPGDPGPAWSSSAGRRSRSTAARSARGSRRASPCSRTSPRHRGRRPSVPSCSTRCSAGAPTTQPAPTCARPSTGSARCSPRAWVLRSTAARCASAGPCRCRATPPGPSRCSPRRRACRARIASRCCSTRWPCSTGASTSRASTRRGSHERREHLGGLRADARLDAARLAYEAGRYTEAGELAEAALGEDPFRESAWRLRMQVAGIVGDEDGVIAAYRGCADALDTLGARPSDATRSLLESLRR